VIGQQIIPYAEMNPYAEMIPYAFGRAVEALDIQQTVESCQSMLWVSRTPTAGRSTHLAGTVRCEGALRGARREHGIDFCLNSSIVRFPSKQRLLLRSFSNLRMPYGVRGGQCYDPQKGEQERQDVVIQDLIEVCRIQKQ
jgi:hypothetical protein